MPEVDKPSFHKENLPPHYYRRIGCYVVSTHYPEEIIRSSLSYKARPEDVYIATYPKCGTTWMQHIIYHIFSNGVPAQDITEFTLKTPFLERVGAEEVLRRPCPSAIKTHTPFDPERFSKHAKYIYVARNPFDCCVSFYYHTRHFPVYQFENGTFDEFFEMFMKGEVDFGDYFDHLLSWYKYKDEENVLFLTYEDIKKDTRHWILKIADFLGNKYGENLREDPSVLDRILELTSVSKMKEAARNERQLQVKMLWDTPREKLPRWAALTLRASGYLSRKPMTGDFVRKGVVGDWRNHFSEEQVDRMKQRIAEKTAGSDVMQLWKGMKICEA
ncbi:sulfotransferase 1C2-like [Ornithodoros turicata]|uniref:sulfotransferase 1C2-like n=1 Tax=Ornithodoros turicata TaxID=34597 RepID=UPI0031394294